jgi:hypothetical protein
MYWLKTYSSEPVMAATFKVDEKTARTQVWKYVLSIQELKEQKVNATGLFRLLQTLRLTLFAFLVLYLYLFYKFALSTKNDQGEPSPRPIQTVLYLPMTVAFFRRRPTLPMATHDGTDLMPNDS